MSQSLLSPRAAQLAAYSRLLLRDKSGNDRVIDFTSPDFEAFREDGANFIDSLHLSRPGAAKAVTEINERMNHWVRSGQPASNKK